jgi:murein DD-endopeptidase MepM/ murein hydrolase activator NlpD
VRYFPSAPWLRRALERRPAWAHPQWIVTLVAVVVAIAGLTVPLAHADDRNDLKHKQNHVRGQISGVRDLIDEASHQVSRISKRLDRAKGQLTSARIRLKSVRADLVKAQTTATALAAKLADAQQKLDLAKAALAQARADVAVQRGESRDAVVSMATGDDARIAIVNAYLNSGSIEDVLTGQTAYDVVTGRQHQALVKLEAAEEAMAKQKAAVADARDAVAAAKKQADEHVVVVTRLVAQATTARNEVLGLVVKTRDARQAVVRARARDRAALRRLEAREAKIRRQILALSKKQGGSYHGDTGGLLARPGPGPITSPFGWRIHPIYGYWGLHNGTDFGTGCGAALWAGESGTVINEYYDEVYGNRLYLAIGKVNGASIVLVYNHLSRYAVHQGAHVKRGQVVGYSGTTGWSTGCHLHFTVLRNGTAVDPMQYL